MGKNHRVYGLMAGIIVGFAMWGSVKATPMPTERGISAATWVQAEKGVMASTEDEKGQTDLGLYAASAVLMDGDTGRVLYEKGGDIIRPMASTTKIMTCILALECGNLQDVCTFSANAAAQPKVHLGAGKGRQFYLKDLLYSLMLESHNDTAVAIAEQVGGSVEGFAAMMNQKARDIGCRDTCFITPNGLDAVRSGTDGREYQHSTTAEDLAAIMRYCIMESPKREEFLAITATANYSFTDVEGSRTYSCVNHNALLQMMNGVLSGKTGFTGGAGYSYVGALESEGRTYVLALLGCGWPPHKTYKWSDARALFAYGKENYHYRDVPIDPELPGVMVKDGITEDDEETELVQVELAGDAESRRLRLLMDESEQVEFVVNLPGEVEAPVREGDILGTVSCLLDGEVIRIRPISAADTVLRKDLPWCFRKVSWMFLNIFVRN